MDIVIVTQCPRLTRSFLQSSPECFEGNRVWVFVDNRQRSHENVPLVRDKAKQFKVRPVGDMSLIQSAIDISVAEGVPVFPHAIDGKSLVGHYNDIWNLTSEQRDFRAWHMSSVKLSAFSAMHDFYGVDNILILDDDTFLFRNPSELQEKYKDAMTDGGIMSKINQGPYDSEMFDIMSECVGHNMDIHEYDKQPLNCGVVIASNLEEYTNVFKNIYQHPDFASKAFRYQNNFRHPSGVLRTIDQTSIGSHQKKIGAGVFENSEARTQGSRKKNGRADYQKSMRTVPYVFHYVDTQLMKWMTAEWLTFLEKNKTNSGKEYMKTPDRWYKLPNRPLEETVALYRGNIDWLKDTIAELP